MLGQSSKWLIVAWKGISFLDWVEFLLVYSPPNMNMDSSLENDIFYIATYFFKLSGIYNSFYTAEGVMLIAYVSLIGEY